MKDEEPVRIDQYLKRRQETLEKSELLASSKGNNRFLEHIKTTYFSTPTIVRDALVVMGNEAIALAMGFFIASNVERTIDSIFHGSPGIYSEFFFVTWSVFAVGGLVSGISAARYLNHST